MKWFGWFRSKGTHTTTSTPAPYRSRYETDVMAPTNPVQFSEPSNVTTIPTETGERGWFEPAVNSAVYDQDASVEAAEVQPTQTVEAPSTGLGWPEKTVSETVQNATSEAAPVAPEAVPEPVTEVPATTVEVPAADTTTTEKEVSTDVTNP